MVLPHPWLLNSFGWRSEEGVRVKGASSVRRLPQYEGGPEAKDASGPVCEMECVSDYDRAEVKEVSTADDTAEVPPRM